MKTSPDHSIIQALRTGQNRQALQLFYDRALPKVRNYILRNNGGEADATDIFQDGVMILYKKVKEGSFDESQSVDGFLFTVCKNRWINRAKKISGQQPISEQENEIEQEYSVIQELISGERVKLLKDVWPAIGERCQHLLKLMVWNEGSLKEAVEKLGFATIHAAKTKHYKCKQRLIQLVSQHPIYHEWKRYGN